jgi:hypothetical protein
MVADKKWKEELDGGRGLAAGYFLILEQCVLDKILVCGCCGLRLYVFGIWAQSAHFRPSFALS